MPDQYLALPQRPDTPNNRGLYLYSSLWRQCFQVSDVYGQATLSNTPYITNPHIVWRQSGEGLAAISSILSQRQVTEAPYPLTADSFERSSGESEAIPGDQPCSRYNQHVVAHNEQITLTRGRPPGWGIDSWGGNVQLCRSHIIDPFSSNEYSGQISQQQWEGTHILVIPTISNLAPKNLASKAVQQDLDLSVGSARSSDNRGRPSREVYYCTKCSKVYSRLQELKRHTRDRHKERHKCPFCCTRWTRPERVRNHVLKSHGRLLSENEQREIRHLRGLEDTVHFLAKCAKIPSRNYMIDAQGPGLPHLF
ncbi:hypothetical protein EDB86DRAFT_486872 [Lactarius hatsudake]|nr:hypothetical protein EDB86DRAFT_486872 [Lactarius hatsudake]